MLGFTALQGLSRLTCSARGSVCGVQTEKGMLFVRCVEGRSLLQATQVTVD